MVRSTVKKVMWVGRATVIMVGLTVIMAVVLGVASAALAGTGAGAPFHLGNKNTVNAISRLVGSVDGPMLLVENNSQGTKAAALSLQTDSGKPPMKVSSSTKVTNLNADQIDGKDSTEFLGKTEKAQDSDKLDGIDSTGFVRGNGSARRGAVAISPNNLGVVLQHAFQSPDFDVYYHCPSTLSNNGTLQIQNLGNETLNVFLDGGGANPVYVQLSPNQTHTNGAAASGEHITLQVQGAGMGTIEVFSVHRTTDNVCHVQAQGLFSY
jgi:hypothetical protein